MVQSVITATTPTWENGKSTFIHNMRLPVHGWYRFPAGFSAEWVESVIATRLHKLEGLSFLDPFAGVGTAVLSGEKQGVQSLGIEAQPFIARVAKAKLYWYTDKTRFFEMAQMILSNAKLRTEAVPEYPPLIAKCFTPDTVRDLHNLLSAWQKFKDDSPVSELVWLAIVSILRACSFAGTAPWQYVLPNRTKSRIIAPYDAFSLQVQRMLSDMSIWQSQAIKSNGTIIQADARLCTGIRDSSVGLIVTSPPYANNYDYADATRLEMTFLQEINGWGDLHNIARKGLVRSCSQHVSVEKTKLSPLLDSLSDTSFIRQITDVCAQLEVVKKTHGGKKAYDVMIAAYFSDMKQIWHSLRRVCADGCEVCFVIGDSAPYGVHAPVDQWLGELAILAGFKSYGFEKIRDRNIKWKNRKHRVPLQEGFLWVQG
jgi:hypothetical protein